MKTEVPSISVIIPLYNAEKYIRQCIDSVLNQTFEDFNVIVIDDCSTDGSYELVRSAYGNDRRVVLMRNEKNRGIAWTHNLGFRVATGKYVATIDNDDVLLPNGLQLLYDVAEHYDAEVVSADRYVRSRGEDIPGDFSGDFVELYDGIPFESVASLTNRPSDNLQIRLEQYLRREFGFWCVWNKLFSRKFLMENDLSYPEAATDRGFIFHVAMLVRRYVKIPWVINIYRNREKSTSRHPPTLEAIAELPGYMSKFAADFERIMNDFDFFARNPTYRYRVIESQLCEHDHLTGARYYPSGRAPKPDVVDAVYRKSAEDFGEHAPFINWLFHRYHVYYRQSLELSARLRQLKRNKNQSREASE